MARRRVEVVWKNNYDPDPALRAASRGARGSNPSAAALRRPRSLLLAGRPLVAASANGNPGLAGRRGCSVAKKSCRSISCRGKATWWAEPSRAGTPVKRNSFRCSGARISQWKRHRRMERIVVLKVLPASHRLPNHQTFETTTIRSAGSGLNVKASGTTSPNAPRLPPSSIAPALRCAAATRHHSEEIPRAG